MSNIREKAREIKDAGEAERGNFEPSGVPLRMYNYWLNNSDSLKAFNVKNGSARENFCHFWRVVAIWAPMLFLRGKINDALNSKVVLGILAAIGIAALVYGAIAYQSVSIVLLIVLISATAIAICIGIGYGLAYLHEKYWNSDWNDVAWKMFLGFALTLIGGMMIAIVTLAIYDIGWIFLAYLAFSVAVVAGIVWGMSRLTTHLSGKRALAEQARLERITAMTHDEYIAFRNGEDSPEPGKVAKFFTGIADFMILIAQVIRVNKWKICPIVTIEKP